MVNRLIMDLQAHLSKNSGIERFLFSQYRFIFMPEDRIIMPFSASGKGNVIRGAFGTTLRHLCCANRYSGDCSICDIRQECVYQIIFDPVEPYGPKRMKNIPRGFIVKPPLNNETEYTIERPFVFDMVLIGRIMEYIPWIVVPLNELGRLGIGKERGRFTLKEILKIGAEGETTKVYDSKTGTFSDSNEPITGRQILKKADEIKTREITIEFLTPTRIRFNPEGKKGESVIIKKPQFHHILRRLRDRISTLCLAYLGAPMDMDFRGIVERAKDVRVLDMDIRWVDAKRISRTQFNHSGGHAIHDKSGFVGKITFEGDLKEFLPLLVLGEYIHVGEDAVFGSGWFRIIK